MSRTDFIVLAGGWSVSQYDLAIVDWMSYYTIGVNDASLLKPCKFALTMDRLWIEGRWRQLSQLYHNNRIYVRRGVAKNFTLPDNVNQYSHDGKCRGMTPESGKLNGSNSGTCAVNLAYQMADPRDRVFLFGFDMQDGPNGEKHWYPPYPWRPNGATKSGTFRTWAEEFAEIRRDFDLKGVELINVNHRSQIKCLPTITFQEFLK